MKIGLGLPTSNPELLYEWARLADSGPFSTLGLLDRLVWDNPEPLITLAALAGVTSRIRLQTEVLLVPLRQPALLASQVATLDRMSGGRFTLGVGVGGRVDDELAAGVPHTGRGARMDAALAQLKALWSGNSGEEPVGPSPTRAGGPEILVGAFHPAALARVARFGDGLLCAAAASWAGPLLDTVGRQWVELGRTGEPRNVAQVNVVVGPEEVIAQARDAISSYYAFTGNPARAVDGLLTTPAEIRDSVRAFTDLGVDEVMLYCWSSDPEQVERLMHAIG